MKILKFILSEPDNLRIILNAVKKDHKIEEARRAIANKLLQNTELAQQVSGHALLNASQNPVELAPRILYSWLGDQNAIILNGNELYHYRQKLGVIKIDPAVNTIEFHTLRKQIARLDREIPSKANNDQLNAIQALTNVDTSIVEQTYLQEIIVVIGQEMDTLLAKGLSDDEIMATIVKEFGALPESYDSLVALEKEASPRHNKNFFQNNPGETAIGALGLVALVVGIILLATGFGAIIGVPLIVGGVIGGLGATIKAVNNELSFVMRGEDSVSQEFAISGFTKKVAAASHLNNTSLSALSILGGQGPEDGVDDEQYELKSNKETERRASVDLIPSIDQEQDNAQNKSHDAQKLHP